MDRSRPWSCDTFVVMADAAADGRVLFGKNSDRPARESQPLRRVPARSGGGRLPLAYLTIDDVAETYEHIASSPYWCWGHEIGMNERGVTIGNEALFTRELAGTVAEDRAARRAGTGRPEPGLLGMELLRLGLERSGSAAEAVEVMINLLERHGQWGAGTVSPDRADAAYDNAFAIMDVEQAFVLETSGRHWAVRPIDGGTAALSNEPTIRRDWTRLSDGLIQRAADQGWPGTNGGFDFAEAVTDPRTPLQVSHLRLQRSRQLLVESAAVDGVDWMAARRILSDHYEDTFLRGPVFNPARPDFLSLCMHDSPAGFTWGNTAASVIARPAASVPYWWWAPTTPCTSLYIPVAAVGSALPEGLSEAGTAAAAGPDPESCDPDLPTASSYWWSFQRLLEAVCQDADGTGYHDRQPVVRAVFDPLQQEFLQAVAELESVGDDDQWDALTARCAHQARQAADQLLADFGAAARPSARIH